VERSTHRIGRGLAALGAVAILLALAAPALAANPGAIDLSSGCTVALTATDPNGAAVGTASNPGPASQNAPFVVDPKGDVAWSGDAPLIRNGSWGVSLFSIPIPGLSGTFANTDGKTSANGSVKLGDITLFGQLAGLVYVTGNVTGEGGACNAAMWVKLNGDPLTSIPGMVGLIMGVVGLLGVLSSIFGRHPFRGLGFGILLGLGLFILPIVFAFMPLGQWTPWVGLVTGPVAGLILGLIGKAGGAAAIAA